MATKEELQELFRKIDLKIDEMTDLKEEFSDYVDELREKVTNYKEHLETIKIDIVNPYGRWEPKEEQEYWYVGDDGNTYVSNFANCTTPNNRYLLGNCYQTEEQAEQALERIKIRTQLVDIALRLNKGQKIDWENRSQDKFSLSYNYVGNYISSDMLSYIREPESVYCLDENFRDIAISEIGEERLAKYLKGE